MRTPISFTGHNKAFTWKQRLQTNIAIRSTETFVRFSADSAVEKQEQYTRLLKVLIDNQQFDLVMGLIEAATTGNLKEPKIKTEAIQAGLLETDGSLVPDIENTLSPIITNSKFQKIYILPKLAQLADDVTENLPQAKQLIKIFQKIYHLQPNPWTPRTLKSLVFEYHFYMGLKELGLTGQTLLDTLKIYTNWNLALLTYKVLHRDKDPFLKKDTNLISWESTMLSNFKTEEPETERRNNMSINPSAVQNGWNNIKTALGVSQQTQLYLDPKTNLVYRPLKGLDIDPKSITNILVPITNAEKVAGQVQIRLPGTSDSHVLDRVG